MDDSSRQAAPPFRTCASCGAPTEGTYRCASCTQQAENQPSSNFSHAAPGTVRPYQTRTGMLVPGASFVTALIEAKDRGFFPSLMLRLVGLGLAAYLIFAIVYWGLLNK